MWAYVFGDDYLLSSPAIGSNKTIVIGTNRGYLCTFASTGIMIPFVLCIIKIIWLLLGYLKWWFFLPDSILTSPAIGSDGSIYVGCNDYSLYAFTSDGSMMYIYVIV